MNNRARRKIIVGIIEKAWLANPAGTINEICQVVEDLLGGPIDIARRRITSFRPKTLPLWRRSWTTQDQLPRRLCSTTIRVPDPSLEEIRTEAAKIKAENFAKQAD